MASGSSSGFTPPGIDRESVCWTTAAGGDTVFTGTIRHDDSLPAPGWVLFDQNQTPVPASTPGLTFVSCDPCCPQQIGQGCWDDGTNTGRWVSFRNADGTVDVIDTITGDPVLSADVVECGTTLDRTFLERVPAGTTFNIPTTQLYSWSVRASQGTVNVITNARPSVSLLLGEVTSNEAEIGALLDDSVQVNVPAGGSALVSYIRRV